MATCRNCGSDVTGKKFCPECGTPVQVGGRYAFCPRCHAETAPDVAFCQHCGTALQPTAAQPHNSTPQSRPCPSCHTMVPMASVFCPGCGYNLGPNTGTGMGTNPNTNISSPGAHSGPTICQRCGRQNDPGASVCHGCGQPLAHGQQPTPTPYPGNQQMPQPYQQPQPPQVHYQQQQVHYPQQQTYPQQPYGQPPYPQQPYGQPPYPQQPYGQPYPQQPPYSGFQPAPNQMVILCPTCRALSPVGASHCLNCHQSLLGIPPIQANQLPPNLQPQKGGFLQSDGGKMAVGALGGAAAAIGGFMLLDAVDDIFDHDSGPLDDLFD